MSTERLHYHDPLLLEFDARVVGVSSFEGAPSVVLDRTAFYAEGGGQPGDRGSLAAAGGAAFDVIDVRAGDDGVVHHLVAPAVAPFFAQIGAVRGVISGARRRDFMSQHTGQHMLSRALFDVARADTLSARLGEEASTIDLDRVVSADELRRAEDIVNAAVLADGPIRASFPDVSALAALALRRAPKVSENVRVIDVEGFDATPCGGTHCTRTGQVGAVHVTATEKFKAGTRLTFVAGARALADYARKDEIVRELVRSFGCPPAEIVGAFAKLRAELKAGHDEASASRSELARARADALLAATPPRADEAFTPIVALRPGDDLTSLRTLAVALATRPDVVALCLAPDENGSAAVVARGAAASFDCGAWFKRVAARTGGKGGGRAERAEGRIGKVGDPASLLAGD